MPSGPPGRGGYRVVEQLDEFGTAGQRPHRPPAPDRGGDPAREALLAVVREHAIATIIHLAAWQVPLCRQDPPKGALINVVGTANVFDAARASGRVERIVYASSAAVFGPPALYPAGPIGDDAPPHPATHYGVYKVANEETARVYWQEHRIPSIGFRPLSVYGPGRDFGLTADPTLAMKAAVLGRAFKIRWGGRTDLVFTEDVARAFIAAARSRLDTAHVYNLHGESAAIADVVRLIGQAWPPAKDLISHVEAPIPFPDALDDARYQRELGRRRRPHSTPACGGRSTSSRACRKWGGWTRENSPDGLRATSGHAGGRRGDLPHLQPGHRGPAGHPGDGAAHARGAPRVDG
jgi:nucleoside-diphosphate-sugar epimerase